MINSNQITFYYFLIKILLSFNILFFSLEINSQKKYNFSGYIYNSKKKPIGYATLWINKIKKGTVTNENGEYIFKNIPEGLYKVKINCLGYQEYEKNFLINKNLFTTLILQTKNYKLDDVVITAKENKKINKTSYIINDDAIEHRQIVNLSEIMALLPGGQTSSKELIYGRKRISLRSEQNEKGDPDFGTAIEIDNIRLSNNGSFDSQKGVDTRIIDPDAIKKIKVIVGIPSVEYGDLTSGIVKIETKQGISPLQIRVSSTPRQKQVSLSKGLKLGTKKGILNLNYNYTKSTSNIASPYTSYIRNTLTLKHKKIFFNNFDSPLNIQTTFSTNLGGYNSKNDPDQFKDDYTKVKAYNLRAGINFDWQLNNKFISRINFSSSFNFFDKKYTAHYNNSSAISTLAFHATKEGYFVGQTYDKNKALAPLQILDRGFWAQTKFNDSKLINYDINFKAQKNIFTKTLITNIKTGINFSRSGNMGDGVSYQNKAYTPSWREFKYKNKPYLTNLGLYGETELKYKFNNIQSVKLTIGVRNDYTFVKDSRYKNVNAISPRFNFSNTLINNTNNFIKNLSWYVGWGKTVKLPSFRMLYNRQYYQQKLSFVPGTLADGTTFYAYYIRPSKVLTNKSLVWQKNKKFEIGVRGKINKINFSIAYFKYFGLDNYFLNNKYSPMSYYLTTQHELKNVKIPYINRKYTINQKGTITVHDNRGKLPNEILPKKIKKIFNSSSFADNGDIVTRQGLEWIVNFGKIKPLQTSLRLDGKYYTYNYINNIIQSDYLTDNQLMVNGEPYKYVGYYYGGKTSANGKKTWRLNANASFITHIPKLRLIISLKIEGTFINSDKNISQMINGIRSFPIKKIGQDFPSDNGNINDGKHYSMIYPLYYVSHDNVNKKIPFVEKYKWASKNDKDLFYDLNKMIQATNNKFLFKKDNINTYFSSNINISKEIGNRIKLTFYANNFLNSLAKIKFSQQKIEGTLLNSGLIPEFSYGLSLKLKL